MSAGRLTPSIKVLVQNIVFIEPLLNKSSIRKRISAGKYPIWYQDSLESFGHEREIAASFAKTIAGACNKKEQGHLK